MFPLHYIAVYLHLVRVHHAILDLLEKQLPICATRAARRAAEFETCWNQYLCKKEKKKFSIMEAADPSQMFALMLASAVTFTSIAYQEIFTHLVDKSWKKKGKQHRLHQSSEQVNATGWRSAAGHWFVCVAVKWYLLEEPDIKCFPFWIQSGNGYFMCHVVIIFSRPPSHCFFHKLKDKAELTWWNKGVRLCWWSSSCCVSCSSQLSTHM